MSREGPPSGQLDPSPAAHTLVLEDETRPHASRGPQLEASAAPFGGDYRALRPLGRGGMAELTLAVDLAGRPARLCVIKRVHAHLASDPQYLAMFRDESRLHALIEHPNVPALYASVEPPEAPPFLALEYVPGPNVAELLAAARQQGFRVPAAFAAGIVAEVAETLAWVHELRDAGGAPLGIVHRDLSPANIVIGWDGAVKVIDFGIAVLADRAAKTEVGVYKGKLAYLAPERILEQPVDARTDQFSLGAVFFELLTGETMFARDDQFATMHAILEGVRPRASALRGDLPVAVDAIVARATDVDRERRFPTLREFISVLSASVPLASRDDLGRLVERLCPAARPLHGALLAQVAELEAAAVAKGPDEDDTNTEPYALLAPRAAEGEEPPLPIIEATVDDASSTEPRPAPRVAPSALPQDDVPTHSGTFVLPVEPPTQPRSEPPPSRDLLPKEVPTSPPQPKG